jgi:hypothetical protein
MGKLKKAAALLLYILFVGSCSNKHTPQQTEAKPVIIYNGRPLVNTPSVTPPRTVTKRVETRKSAVPKTAPAAAPKVILVNDNVAKKNIDGRLYYDVEGRRYWRNYNDGKYYLFNRSMYTDSAFKPH